MEIFFEPDLPNRPGFVFNRCRECDSAHALSFTSVAVNDRLRAKGFKIVNPTVCGMCSSFHPSKFK